VRGRRRSTKSLTSCGTSKPSADPPNQAWLEARLDRPRENEGVRRVDRLLPGNPLSQPQERHPLVVLVEKHIANLQTRQPRHYSNPCAVGTLVFSVAHPTWKFADTPAEHAQLAPLFLTLHFRNPTTIHSLK
jgi:hypothetical protein